MPDGLTIYFTSQYRDGRPNIDIFKAQRFSLDDPFGNIQLVEFPGQPTMWENHCYITPDEKELYFEISGEGIYVVYFGYHTEPCMPR